MMHRPQHRSLLAWRQRCAAVGAVGRFGHGGPLVRRALAFARCLIVGKDRPATPQAYHPARAQW